MIKNFDPWDDSLCTCPPKYTINPYTGCSHRCIYCYISSYIKDPFFSRPKKNAVEGVKREINKIKDRINFISLSNSSDPYPPIERELGITREVLQILNQNNINFQIVTKSDLVLRDIDLMEKNTVSMTITSMKNSKRIEPGAPDSGKRLNALQILSDSGINCSLRLDPVIPGINDDPENLRNIIEKASVKHVISSTFKPRIDSLKRMKIAFPDLRWDEIYKKKRGNSLYMDRTKRLMLMNCVRDLCEEAGLSFSCCREGFDMNDGKCDGSHLLGGVG